MVIHAYIMRMELACMFCYKLQTCHPLTNVTDMIQTQKEEEEETLIERIKSLKGLDSLKRVHLER
jgi:hypothetical protein